LRNYLGTGFLQAPEHFKTTTFAAGDYDISILKFSADGDSDCM
jgi:hypothetical protein